ncbi:MAG: pyridoxamine 5'-phosphate oxidase family protein [Bacteroidota bacterium]|nr:pyridoxamine 5'-phosphate oxidase family protein [Bacteroidota bacterium]
MGDTKNLVGKAAIEEIRSLVKDLGTCMFCTYDEKGELQARPMAVQQADEEGNLWFLSKKGSEKNQQLMSANKTDLLFGEGKDKWMCLHGTAVLMYDREKIKELWTPIAKIWFTEGENDPSISVIRFRFKSGYYWDNKHGRMVAIAKMAAAFITGETMDDGVEGQLISQEEA